MPLWCLVVPIREKTPPATSFARGAAANNAPLTATTYNQKYFTSWSRCTRWDWSTEKKSSDQLKFPDNTMKIVLLVAIVAIATASVKSFGKCILKILIISYFYISIVGISHFVTLWIKNIRYIYVFSMAMHKRLLFTYAWK